MNQIAFWHRKLIVVQSPWTLASTSFISFSLRDNIRVRVFSRSSKMYVHVTSSQSTPCPSTRFDSGISGQTHTFFQSRLWQPHSTLYFTRYHLPTNSMPLSCLASCPRRCEHTGKLAWQSREGWGKRIIYEWKWEIQALLPILSTNVQCTCTCLHFILLRIVRSRVPKMSATTVTSTAVRLEGRCFSLIKVCQYDKAHAQSHT